MIELPATIEKEYGNLNVRSFARMLDDPTECYKFYWLEGILELLSLGKIRFRFEEVIDRMLANCWYTVTFYHLHLGPKNKFGQMDNQLEAAINRLNDLVELPLDVDEEDILKSLQINDSFLIEKKRALTRHVPYRLLSSFLTELDGNHKLWESRGIRQYIREYNQTVRLPYIILEASQKLDYEVVLDDQWAEFMRSEFSILMDWIRFRKVLYLQNKNPGVPGIVYKIEREDQRARKLKNARNLWNAVIEIQPFSDIYTGSSLEKGKYAVDHFIPWSFVANDELWNLIPTNASSNSKKSNKLPVWEKYGDKYIINQFELYSMIWKYDSIKGLFDKCRNDNLNSIWALEELYIPKHNLNQFRAILEPRLVSLYDSARIQGFELWNTDK